MPACVRCSTEFIQIKRGRHRKYCSEKCRDSIAQGTFYRKHRELRLTKEHVLGRKRRRKLREEVLLAYSPDGPKYACCGIAVFEFLVMDHIDGGGNRHIKEIGCEIYSWLKKNGFPAGFRVLCDNCNSSRGRYGYCPHERELTSVD